LTAGKAGLRGKLSRAIDKLLPIGKRGLFVLLDRPGLLFKVLDVRHVGFVVADLNRKVVAGQPFRTGNLRDLLQDFLTRLRRGLAHSERRHLPTRKHLLSVESGGLVIDAIFLIGRAARNGLKRCHLPYTESQRVHPSAWEA
jgi:hypothetical protein